MTNHGQNEDSHVHICSNGKMGNESGNVTKVAKCVKKIVKMTSVVIKNLKKIPVNK